MDFLEGFLAQVGIQPDFAKPISEERMVKLLTEVGSRISAAVPFKVGQLVTPRETSSLRSIGLPHIVIAVNENAGYQTSGDPIHHDFGGRLTVRVAHVAQHGNDVTILCHWVEHHELEHYTDAHRQKCRAAIADSEARIASIMAEASKRQADAEATIKH